MKRFLRRFFPLLLAAAILVAIGWYLFIFDPAFTRDLLLSQARHFESSGKHSAAVWCYNMAYRHSDGSDEVAIELAQQFKDIGNFSKAEYTLRQALEDGGSKALYMALSKTYVQQGKLRDAVLLLENADKDVKDALEQARPAAPTASLESGSYNRYLTVEISCDNGKLYVSTDGDYPSAKTDAYTGPISLGTGETTIYAISVSDNGLVSSLVVFTYIINDVVEEVSFTDAAFEATVRNALQLQPGDSIYSNDLWTLKELTLPAEVTDCSDLKWLKNLEKLTIQDASISGLAALPQLDSLKELTIRNCVLSSAMLESIGACTQLERLTLADCAISSVASLSGLTNLRYLDLNENAIRDLSGLSEMIQLEYLDLRSNALISLEGLEKLHKVQHLDVSYNSLTSVEDVGNMAALTYLNLSSNALRSLDGVQHLSLLTQFIAQYNELVEVDVLRNCQKLQYLDVSYNTLINVNVTAALPELRELYFAHNEVSQLPKYDKNCKLNIISGGHNQISSLGNLAGLANIEYIYMDYNEEISSVNSLVSCPVLKELYVYGTKVRSVSKLTEIGIYVVYSPV